jgi:hypothetical protein
MSETDTLEKVRAWRERLATDVSILRSAAPSDEDIVALLESHAGNSAQEIAAAYARGVRDADMGSRNHLCTDCATIPEKLPPPVDAGV